VRQWLFNGAVAGSGWCVWREIQNTPSWRRVLGSIFEPRTSWVNVTVKLSTEIFGTDEQNGWCTFRQSGHLEGRSVTKDIFNSETVLFVPQTTVCCRLATSNQTTSTPVTPGVIRIETLIRYNAADRLSLPNQTSTWILLAVNPNTSSMWLAVTYYSSRPVICIFTTWHLKYGFAVSYVFHSVHCDVMATVLTDKHTQLSLSSQ
jgi:hypothetical protein